jgi:hypothetical protein
MSGWGSNWFYC